MNNADEIIGFKDEIASIQKAITDFESGQKLDIAIISEPFAGRTTLLNEIERITTHKVTKLPFSAIVKNENDLMFTENSRRIVMIDNCQFLYMRKIGGFNILEEFFKSIASSNSLFITTWNIYSWNYLDEVINISRFFPIQLKLPRLTTDETKELILSGYKEDELKFIDDVEYETKRLINFFKYPVTIKSLEKTINIPFFKINFNLLKFSLTRKEEKKKAEEIIFEMIERGSDGNHGVAKIIWEKSLEYPTIKSSFIRDLSFKIELDYSESFILYIILSMESIKKEELVEITGETHIDEILYRLSQQGLITVDQGYCKIKPEALKSSVEFLKKSRMVW